MNVRLIIRAIRNCNHRSAAIERDLVTLADAINQYGIKMESVAERELQGSEARLDHEKAQRRYREKLDAIRALRTAVARVIYRLDP